MSAVPYHPHPPQPGEPKDWSPELARLEARIGQQLETMQLRIDRASVGTIERLDRLADALASVAAMQAGLLHCEQRIDHIDRRQGETGKRVGEAESSITELRTELRHWERTGRMLWAVVLTAVVGAVWLLDRMAGR